MWCAGAHQLLEGALKPGDNIVCLRAVPLPGLVDLVHEQIAAKRCSRDVDRRKHWEEGEEHHEREEEDPGKPIREEPAEQVSKQIFVQAGAERLVDGAEEDCYCQTPCWIWIRGSPQSERIYGADGYYK